MSTADLVVSARQVTKQYRQQKALDSFDLDVYEGEIFGLLGPNGAGKTTFIKILVGLATPNSGSVHLFGEDLFARRHAAARRLGAVVEAPIFFEYMSGWENLFHLAALSGGASRDEIKRALRIVGLQDAADKEVRAYSYGMKQRLGIAQALLPHNRFLILDEPTNGLDPHGIAGVRDLIRVLARDYGLTIFLSSHLLTEVEQVCDRVTIIDHGRKVLEGTVEELKADETIVIVRLRQAPDAEELLAKQEPIHVQRELEMITGHFAVSDDAIPQLVRDLVEAGADLLEVKRRERTLEDIFIEHTRGSDPVDARHLNDEETPD